MSRSKPTNNTPHPCTRWLEWDGSKGRPRYYDKQEKKQVELEPDFTFILLDQTATVRGWHDPSESGIYANEVRDTRASPLTVKAYQAGILAEGMYSEIRDRVRAVGGHFTNNCYIAYKNDAGLELGCLQFKGAALNAWVEFSKANRPIIYKQAVRIDGYQEGKKGKITFRVPVFKMQELSDDTNEKAVAVDRVLQEYFDEYFKRTHTAPNEPEPTTAEPDPANMGATMSPEQPEEDTPF